VVGDKKTQRFRRLLRGRHENTRVPSGTLRKSRAKPNKKKFGKDMHSTRRQGGKWYRAKSYDSGQSSLRGGEEQKPPYNPDGAEERKVRIPKKIR